MANGDSVEVLFHQAADLPPDGQRALLDAACANDPELRAQVEELLAADARYRDDEAGAAILKSPLAQTLAPSTFPAGGGRAQPPAVGRYRIVRLLGEGGMGTVYEAEQDNPRRRVALKVIRTGLVSPALRKRFDAEAQILGRLHHPGIAAIYEAGVAEDGRPFFALEYIRGLPLGEYARQHNLSFAARLDLLARVCDAVQHAHEQGVIHRDLKPSNILVDETGQPRVLDFGVARVSSADLDITTDRTQTGQLMGTLNYMSPEQVTADPAALDWRSDVYTLGVILFELLTGRLPYPLADLPLPEAARVIREQEPAALGSLDHRLRGDPETIVARALEKDRDRRYASAADLAADLRRYLRHEPIRARPASALYHLGKLARRHKALVAMTTTFLGLLLAGGAVTAWQAVQLARTERDQVTQQARRSEEIHEALAQASSLREQARAAPGILEKWAEARALVRRAEALAESGPVETGLAERVALLQDELDREERDRRMVADLETIRLQQAEVRDDDFDFGAAAPRYAEAFRRYGVDLAELPVAEAARRVRQSAIRETLLAALDDWRGCAPEDANPQRPKLHAVADAADDNDWRRRLRAAAGRRDGARLKALAADPRALEQPAPVLVFLGVNLRRFGLPEEAAVFLRQAQQRHPDDFWLNHSLALVLFAYLRPQRIDEALGYFRAALALRPRSPGVWNNLGNALRAQGQLPAAVACFHRALELDPPFALAHANLGEALQAQGDLPGAVAHLRRAVQLNPRRAQFHFQLGVALRQKGDRTGADASLGRARELAANDAAVLNNLGADLREQGKLTEALACLRRAVALEPSDAAYHSNLGDALQAGDDLAGAVACFRRAIDLDPQLATAHYNLGVVLLRQGKAAAATACFRRAIEREPNHAEAHCNLGQALVAQGQFQAARAEFDIGHDLGSRRPDWGYPSDRWLGQCRQFCELEPRLAAVLKGASPSADERVELAVMCHCRELDATAVRLFRGAFAADPRLEENLAAGHRYHAACSAARLGCGRGKEAAPVSVAERARFRQQALEWLRAELASLTRDLNGSPRPNRAPLWLLLRWQTDPALAGVREPGLLARFPAAERVAWQNLWAEVAAVVTRARGFPGP